MQDFQPLPGRVFGGGGGVAAGGGGGGGAELRRLASYPATAARHQQQQPVKCPRCDSTNTKFCYYNNYNLSQPRHFCKSCRRYWTMGGVLRNVPVGGGCRKSKRPFSSSKPSPSAADEDPDHRRRRRPSSSASRCSSDSSSLTASTSAPFPDPTLLTSHSQIPISDPNPPFEPLAADPPLCPAPYFFQDTAAGSFSATEATPAAILGFSLPEQPTVQEKAAAVNGPGFIDQTVPVDSMPHGGGGGLPAMDWPGPVDPMLFDLTSAVDAAAYWNESHWVDADPSLYLP